MGKQNKTKQFRKVVEWNESGILYWICWLNLFVGEIIGRFSTDFGFFIVLTIVLFIAAGFCVPDSVFVLVKKVYWEEIK